MRSSERDGNGVALNAPAPATSTLTGGGGRAMGKPGPRPIGKDRARRRVGRRGGGPCRRSHPAHGAVAPRHLEEPSTQAAGDAKLDGTKKTPQEQAPDARARVATANPSSEPIARRISSRPWR